MTQALSARRQRFIDNLRALHESRDGDSDVDSYLLEERKRLLSSLLVEAEAEQMDLSTLLQVQDTVLQELADDINTCLTHPHISTDSIICPVCNINALSLSGTVLSCVCGMRIDTQTDSVTLEAVTQSLQSARETHSASGCSHTLRGWVMHQAVSDVRVPCRGGPGMQSDHQQQQYPTDHPDQIALLCVGCDVCAFLEIVV